MYEEERRRVRESGKIEFWPLFFSLSLSLSSSPLGEMKDFAKFHEGVALLSFFFGLHIGVVDAVSEFRMLVSIIFL